MRSCVFSRPVRTSIRPIVFALCLSVCIVTLVFAPGGANRFSIGFAAAGAPVLLTQASSTRGIALDSVTGLAEPFDPQTPVAFAGDARTRLMLFATNLTLAAGENAAAVTAEAEDAQFQRYPLTVEYVGAVPGQSWMTAVVVRLNDSLGDDVGDVLVGITYHGMTSNRVRLGLGHIGGGPPDDPPATPTPTPGATPDLGPGASLHGKQLFPVRQSLEPGHLDYAGRSEFRQPDRQHRLKHRPASGLRHRLQRRAERHSLRGRLGHTTARGY